MTTTTKPQSIKIMNEAAYSAEEIYNYDTAFFVGCSRTTRLIVEKKRLQENDYFFAYQKKGKWTISTANYPRAKLFLREEYVVKNVPKMMDDVKKELYKYEEAPPILELENEEKFKDKNGNVIEIEVRGERKHDGCFFKVKDVSIGFELPNLNTTLLHKDGNDYKMDLHYKYFSVSTIFILNKTISKNKKCLFLTYMGFQKLINVSRNNMTSNIVVTMIKWLQQFDNSILKQYIIPDIKIIKDNRIGYVYCITSNLINAIKIGFWTGTIDGLKKRYYTYFGNDIELFYVYTKNPNRLEYNCHKEFDNYKITNELFEKHNLQDYITYLEINKNPPTVEELQMLQENNEIVVEYFFENTNEKIQLLEKQLIEEKHKNEAKDKELEFLKTIISLYRSKKPL
jgi:hypothetical protein